VRILIRDIDEPPYRTAGLVRKTFGVAAVNKFRRHSRRHEREIRTAIGAAESREMPAVPVQPGDYVLKGLRFGRVVGREAGRLKIFSKTDARADLAGHIKSERTRLTQRQIRNLCTLLGLAPKRRNPKAIRPKRDQLGGHGGRLTDARGVSH
jgi:hypothetical protein